MNYDLLLFHLIEKRKYELDVPKKLNISQAEFNFELYNEFIHVNKLSEYCVKHPGVDYKNNNYGSIIFTNIIDQIIRGLTNNHIKLLNNNSYKKAKYLISLLHNNEIFCIK